MHEYVDVDVFKLLLSVQLIVSTFITAQGYVESFADGSCMVCGDDMQVQKPLLCNSGYPAMTTPTRGRV